MATRGVLIALIVLGLAIGACSGLEQAPLGRSIYLVSEVSDGREAGKVAAPLSEALQTLEVCFNLTTASMYLGAAVVLVASLGLYFKEKR